MSKIEWTQKTWNPIVGCSLKSPGCTNCYAMKMAGRLEAMGQAPYQGTTQRTKNGFAWTGQVNLSETALLAPLKRKTPTVYFVNSMSDLFHESVPDEWIDRIFAVMALCPQHTFQVLTKRSDRMRAYFEGIENGNEGRLLGDGWRDALVEGCAQNIWQKLTGDQTVDEWLAVHLPLLNVWLGVSVEDQARADERIPDLLDTPAAVRFLSCEPLLGPLDLECVPWPANWNRSVDDVSDGIDPLRYSASKIDWVICGGESGPGARPMHPDWARSLRDQCAAAGTAFFFKQWGDWRLADQSLPQPSAKSRKGDFWRVGKKAAGNLLDGVVHAGYPR